MCGLYTSLYGSLQGVLSFLSVVNYDDFHQAEQMCFIPKLLNCSKKAVVQSFDFIGELLKKTRVRAWFHKRQNNELEDKK